MLPSLLLSASSILPAHASEESVETVLRGAAQGELADWRLKVDCAGSDGVRSFDLLTRGIGVWDLWTQVRVPAMVERELAATLLKRGFLDLDSEYGGKTPRTEGTPEPPAKAQRVICRVAVDFTREGHQYRRSSVQFLEGEQSAELKSLANALLDLAQPLAEKGVRTTTLEEALERMGAGEIDPALLRARLVALPQRGGERASGSILAVERGMLTHQPYEPGQSIGPIERQSLSIDELKPFVAALVEASYANLPINLWAEDQLELHIEILGHRRSLYARPFARLEPTTLGDQQEAFNGLVEALRGLAAKSP